MASWKEDEICLKKKTTPRKSIPLLSLRNRNNKPIVTKHTIKREISLWILHFLWTEKISILMINQNLLH